MGMLFNVFLISLISTCKRVLSVSNIGRQTNYIVTDRLIANQSSKCQWSMTGFHWSCKIWTKHCKVCNSPFVLFLTLAEYTSFLL